MFLVETHDTHETEPTQIHELTQTVFASPSQNASTWKTATSGMVDPVARAALAARSLSSFELSDDSASSPSRSDGAAPKRRATYEGVEDVGAARRR